MANNKLSDEQSELKRFKIKASIFLATVAGVAAGAGFTKTMLAAKKEEQKLLEKGLISSAHLLDSGSSLAMRALGWGTLYAVLGTGTICYGIWKLSGATNMMEFRQKMGSKLIKISNDAPPKSRTEFEGLTDLIEYLTIWKGEK